MVLAGPARARDVAQGVPGAQQEGQPDAADGARAPLPAEPPHGAGHGDRERHQRHRPHRARHDQQNHQCEKTHYEDRPGQAAQRGDDHERPQNGGRGVAGPGGGDPPRTAGPSGGHGVTGQVLLDDEALEAPPHQHADARVPRLVDDGHQGARGAPRRRPRHDDGHQGQGHPQHPRRGRAVGEGAGQGVAPQTGPVDAHGSQCARSGCGCGRRARRRARHHDRGPTRPAGAAVPEPPDRPPPVGR